MVSVCVLLCLFVHELNFLASLLLGGGGKIDVVGCIEAALPPDLLRSRKIVSVSVSVSV